MVLSVLRKAAKAFGDFCLCKSQSFHHFYLINPGLTLPGLLHDYNLQIVKGPIDCKENLLFHFQKNVDISVFMPFLCFLLA